MADEGFKRKLTAILSADVEGYSRLMGDDEEATVRTLTSYREVISTLIQQRNGIVLDSPGDNMLAEFASVVDAVQCSVAVQKEIKSRNDELPENRRMQFRIGVNLGDVIQEKGRIYGDGVNIAARLEGMADAGGICISRTAYGQVKNKLELGYEYLGEQSVKNISEPVHVYKVLMEAAAIGKVIGEKRKTRIGIGLAIALIILIGAGGLTGWYLYIQQSKRVQPASIENMAYPLPDKPSIAVLPFDNMSGDPEQEYFSDGLSEDIITALSKTNELFVTARNSSFTYKGKPVKIKKVSEELGVRYVLEGSVRKSGDRLRITAQLIDAIKGRHIWAEKYDRDLKDIFEIQDDITFKILTALQAHLTLGEENRVWAKDAPNLEVHLKGAKAFSFLNEGGKENIERFGQLSQEIVDMAPESPMGYRMLGWYYQSQADMGIKPRESMKKAFDMAQKALSMNESDADAHALLSALYRKKKEYDKSVESGMLAVELAPNGALKHLILGQSLLHACRDDEALVHLKRAFRLNPFPAYYYHYSLGRCYFAKGQYEEALLEYEKTLQRNPNYNRVHFSFAVTYAFLGREEEARASAVKARKLWWPKVSVKMVTKYWDYKCKDNLEIFLDAMRKAGFPE
jgi:adenylate cyclase